MTRIGREVGWVMDGPAYNGVGMSMYLGYLKPYQEEALGVTQRGLVVAGGTTGYALGRTWCYTGKQHSAGE